MFSKKITLSASKNEFVFSDGERETRFRPSVHLAENGKKILAVGPAPQNGSAFVTVNIFEDPQPAVDALIVLESMLRFGMRSLASGFLKAPPSLRVVIANDIWADLRGFTPALFRAAALGGGALKVAIEGETPRQALQPKPWFGRD
jgi:hypothetical protein